MTDEIVELNMDMICFQIISNVGTAKSLVMEAIYAARDGNYSLAEEKIEEAQRYFVEGHKIHSTLIQKEASGQKLHVSLILMHAEDQLMSAETISELVKEMIEMYKKINDLQPK
jgi:PTS system cellobiose-specific IIA component